MVEQVTSINIGSIEDIPLPDISVGLTSHIGVWRAVAHFLKQADSGKGIVELYQKVPKLSEKLHIQMINAAYFKLDYDNWADNFHYEALCSAFCSKFDIVPDFCDAANASQPINMAYFEGNHYSRNDANIMSPFIKEWFSKCIIESCSLTVGQHNGILVQQFHLYESLGPEDLIHFLTDMLSKEGHLGDFSQSNMNKIYSYISQMSQKIPNFNKLPIPVGVQLTLARRPSKTILKNILGQDYQHTMYFANYNHSLFPNFYQELYLCLSTDFKNCSKRDAISDILDPLMRATEQVKEIVEFAYGQRGDGWPVLKACRTGPVSLEGMIQSSETLKCDFAVFSQNSLDFTLMPEPRKVGRFDALQQKQMMFIFDLTNSHDNFDNIIHMSAQEHGELSDYLGFNSRTSRLGFGKHHIIEAGVSRFIETERHRDLAENHKQCSSSNTIGYKRKVDI